MASGLIGRGAQRDALMQARSERVKAQRAFGQMDTSNLYADLTNPFQNLTVNQQQADFMRQQRRLSQANTLSMLRGAAGSSGVAGLAQALQGQANLAAAQDSASIGIQERQNQLAAAQGSMQLQQLKAGGEAQARALKQRQIETQFGLAAGTEAAALQGLAMTDQVMIEGIASGLGAAAGGVAGQLSSRTPEEIDELRKLRQGRRDSRDGFLNIGSLFKDKGVAEGTGMFSYE